VHEGIARTRQRIEQRRLPDVRTTTSATRGSILTLTAAGRP
jgi:hypothetical protein